MNKRALIKLIFFISIFFCSRQMACPQRIDTLYFNSGWQICEKPFASYYRFGKIVIDTFWYYTGRLQDYYMNGKLEMDGNYSSTGEKDGQFWFFYPDGTLKAKGSYTANQRLGIWEYYHLNGLLKLRINYTNDIKKFTVIDFIDSTGRVLAKDSTGNFEMSVSNEFGVYVYRLEGEFKEGKKYGSWRYYLFMPSKNQDFMMLKEIYENGELKRGVEYNPFFASSQTYKKQSSPISMIEFNKFRATEGFAKDRTSFPNTKDDQDLFDYLATRKLPEFDAEDTSFIASYINMLKILNTYTVLKYFQDPEKIYKGEILFNLSDSGDIEEVEISGNLSEKEKEYMLFFVKKFKNIHEILVENVGIDAYHKIYFYTVIFAEFFPKRYSYYLPEKTFLFSVLPYDKLKEVFNEKKKKKKNK